MSDNLGRLVAAERNALAAIEFCKELRDTVKGQQAQIARLEADNVALRQELQATRALAARTIGSAATAQ